MSGPKIIWVIVVASLAVGCIGFAMIRMQKPKPNEPGGTSVVVLVDFSKSFAASRRRDSRIVYGLRYEDYRALKAVAGAVAEIASHYWNPPIKTVWTQIRTSSIAAEPLCAPLEALQKLVMPEGNFGTRDQIDSVLSECAASVVAASQYESRLSSHTDISGAVAIASEIASGEYSKRVLVILSDFQQDLPPGNREATFRLNGERVVLLHRPGTDEPQSVEGYISRLDFWKKKLFEGGAAEVVAMPVSAVTESRLRLALHPETEGSGTVLSVLVDFKENVSTPLKFGVDNKGLLQSIGQTLAGLADEWPRPVTALWSIMGETGFDLQLLQPIVFDPRIIKRPGAINTVNDFKIATEESTVALLKRARRTTIVDISGSLALTAFVEPVPEAYVLILISDFVDGGARPEARFRLTPGTRVVMLHVPSPSDRSDPNEYTARRQLWEQRLRQNGAVEVFQFPLLSFTSSDLRACLGNNN